jgi:hypothetical protein
MDNQWLLGFVSAAGEFGPGDPGAVTDAQGIIAWVSNACTLAPADDLAAVARAFVYFALRGR